MTKARVKDQIKLVSIILPTYNEAENIIELIKQINRKVEGKKEIIIVDDNSPDMTSKIVKKYIKKTKSKNTFLKTRYTNHGLTNSIKEGIRLSKGDVVVWLDCDFSMPPKVINRLLFKIKKGNDIAVGSRFVKGGRIKELDRAQKDSPLAIMLSRLMNYSIQLLLGWHFKDYTSGFIAVKKSVFKNISLRGDYGEYFIDFIYKAFAYDYKIAEIPYVCVSRRAGESKTGNNMWQYLKRGRKYMLLTFQLLVEKHLFHKIP